VTFEFSYKKYAELSNLLAAFKIRDIQTTATIFGWLVHNGYTMLDLGAYLEMYPKLYNLDTLRYFNPNPTVEHSEAIKRFEKTLPKQLRSELRKLRLAMMREGPSKSG